MDDDHARPPRPGTGSDDDRHAALRDTGLSARPEPGMDRFARLVSRVLAVPVALVCLVEPDRQIFPGLIGLGEPWVTSRATPLSHSLCQQIVATAAPLVLPDAAGDERWHTHPAVTELKVAAYAGMPLTDDDGHVLGSLAAIDTAPRDWTDAQLADLSDLASACIAELRLRIVSRRAAHDKAVAERVGERAATAAERIRVSLAQSQLLLRAAEDLADTTGLIQVRRQVSDLVTSDLKPSYVGLVLIEGNRLHRVIDADHGGPAMERTYETYDLDDAWPTARAARDNTTIVIPDTGQLAAAGYSPDAVAASDSLGLRTAICVPLPGTRTTLGTLVIGWDTSHEVDLAERAVITALAGYTARAIERAQFVDTRISVARQLQEAMLTDLPDVPGLDIAALYRPAAAGELVGGDWYDAYRLPALDGSGPGAVAVTIGDITGHDIQAATLMGQLRSMLRQADLDHLGTGPALVVTALEQANRALEVGASGTLIHCHLRPGAEGGWDLTWTTAGHPPALLRHPDGTVDTLPIDGIMIHPKLPVTARTEHRTTMRPGSALLLYTDGLIDQPGRDIDAGIARAAALVTEHAGLPLRQLLEVIADQVGGRTPEDDIALIAIGIPEQQP